MKPSPVSPSVRAGTPNADASSGSGTAPASGAIPGSAASTPEADATTGTSSNPEEELMEENVDGGGTQRGAGAIHSVHVSRRDFLGSALASSLVVAGLPLRALAALGEPTSTGSRVRDVAQGIVNVQISQDGPGRGHYEPWLAVNPRNPRNLLVVSMPGPDTYVSFDRGLTWRNGGALRLPAGSGGGNVSAGFDGAGRGFVCGLFGAAATGKNSVRVWRTEDGGRRFGRSVVLAAGANLDRPWLAAERHSPGVVHVVWSEGPSAGLAAGLQTELRYTRSTDGGRTFEPPRTIASKREGLGNPMVACGRPGSVYVIYSVGRGQRGNAPPDSRSAVTVVCSHDRGRTFRRPTELARATIFTSFPHLTAGGSSLPAIAAHRHSGLVCAAFTDHKPGAAQAAVLLAASRDGGRTWSRATPITPEGPVIYFQPEVAIEDAGRIGVMAFAMDHDMVRVALMISDPGSRRFGPPITVTDHPFDPARVNDQLGDYQTLATTPGVFHPLWNDTRTGQLELFTAAVRLTR